MSLKTFLAAAALSLAATSAFAQAQNVNIRGTISSFDGKAIAVKMNDGRDVSVDVPENTNVNITKPFSVTDIKQGMKLAVTTVKGPNGAVMAIDVRPLGAAANVSQSAYDLAPESLMNNAVLEATAETANGQELTLNYNTGTIKALITPSTRMSQSAPGAQADLKPGETIFLVARREGDKYTAVRMQVSKDGVKPTQ